MLDLTARELRWSSGAFELSLSLAVSRGQHVALTGGSGAGKTTLLSLLAGELRPSSGTIHYGSREATTVRAKSRPVFVLRTAAPFPHRWSPEHALIAALRGRSLDRIDRFAELQDLTSRWNIAECRERRYGTLSAVEQLRVRLAVAEATRPPVILAESPFAAATSAERSGLAAAFHAAMRVAGITVITETSTHEEMGWADRVVVMERGKIVQEGIPSQVSAIPAGDSAARATGEVNRLPVEIRGTTVRCAIGEWTLGAPGMQGNAVALSRPWDFNLAPAGEEYDFLLGIERAQFTGDGWMVQGYVTGAILLSVKLPATTEIRKGRLLPLRFDPSRLMIVPE